MRIPASLGILVALLGPVARSQTTPPTTLGLGTERIPAECKEVGGNYRTDIQTAILWDNTDLYKTVIPMPVAKKAQSFVCQDKKGTVYFFKYANETERTHAGSFIRELLWGEPQPNKSHPELVLESGDVLTVVSFWKAPESLLVALQGGTTSSTPKQETIEGTNLPIPGHGNLWLRVPDGWQIQTKQVADPASVTLHLTPTSGDAFDMYITAVWLDADKQKNTTSDWLKNVVQDEADKVLPQAVEKTVTLHDLRGPQCIGYYFALTDRAPKPGEHKYMTQGVFSIGELLTTFTALHRTMESPDVPNALRVLAEATYTK
jgi:hypothetical protein